MHRRSWPGKSTVLSRVSHDHWVADTPFPIAVISCLCPVENAQYVLGLIRALRKLLASHVENCTKIGLAESGGTQFAPSIIASAAIDYQ